MTIADILTFAGIAVSIIFGYFVAHFHSIRDTRTRVLKDYYIEQVKVVKTRVDKFFHRVAFGGSSFNKIINWYAHLSIDIRGIDKGVRKSLDLQIIEILDFIDKFYGEITNWEDFNNQFSNPNYIPTTQHKQRLLQMKYEIDDFFNDYVSHLNQSNNYPIWTIQYRRMTQSYNYYKNKGYKYALGRSIWERIEKHFWEGLVILAIILTTCYLTNKIEIEKKDDLATPLNNISDKQELIYRELYKFIEKYEPIEIQSKTFNNSSFFNADKVDCVQIKVYQSQPQQ